MPEEAPEIDYLEQYVKSAFYLMGVPPPKTEKGGVDGKMAMSIIAHWIGSGRSLLASFPVWAELMGKQSVANENWNPNLEWPPRRL